MTQWRLLLGRRPQSPSWWSLLRQLPGTSERFGPPRQFCDHTETWIDHWNVTAGRPPATYVELHPPGRLNRKEPGTVYGQSDWQDHWWHEACRITCPVSDSAATFLATIPNGRVLGEDGAVIAADDTLLGEVSVDLAVVNAGDAGAHGSRCRWRLPPVKQLEGDVAVLSVLGGHNYFHWMFQLLPRIKLMRDGGVDLESIDWFITNEIHHPFQRETLAALGIPRGRIIESSASSHYRADRLLVASRPSRMSEMPLWVCEFLRNHFLPERGGEDRNRRRPERLYLSRADSGHRRVLNETQVLEFLKDRGFVSVSLESMSVTQQALLLHSAKVVVAPHGAGLANLVFCRPGATVIEFFSPEYVNCCYWALSNWMDARYFYVFGEGGKPSDDHHVFELLEDVVVDLDALSKVMELAQVL
jgi:capsular polysaccharide biosynthesis protein